MAALPAPHPEELALLTSPKDFKGGRTSTSKADTSPFLASGPVDRRRAGAGDNGHRSAAKVSPTQALRYE